MFDPTKQEERLAFYQLVMPGFLEYLRTHQVAIEQVELALVKDGIVSFPATQILGGVQKTVRVPLSMLTHDLDIAEDYVMEMADYAKEQGDYAAAQTAQLQAMAEYAEEQGDDAAAQAAAALAAKNEVTTWFPPFKLTAESFYNNTMLGVWLPWYNSFKSTAEGWYTPFVNNAESWLAARLADWASFYTNGAVPAWATLRQAVESATALANEKATLANEKAALADGKATLANNKAEEARLAAVYAGLQGDRSKAFNDHPWEIGNDGYIWVWDETHDNGDDTHGAMVRTNKMIISFDEITEEQIQRMINAFYAGRVIASVETGEAIVDELT